MTMIGCVAGEDSAQIITDGLMYKRSGRHVLPAPVKTVALPGMPAVVACQGNPRFYEWWLWAAPDIAAQVDDFDEFTEAADGILPGALNELKKVHDSVPDHALSSVIESIAFHVGWSPRAGRFVAYAYASDFGFQRIRIDGLHIQPTPFAYRPGVIEHLRASLVCQAVTGNIQPIALWAQQPPPPVPATVPEWVELAKQVRRSRALNNDVSALKVFVGGDVELTTVIRDGVTTEVVHTFDDPDEFRVMVAGTLHPFAQEGPCPDCDSGQRWIDCHLAEQADQPCWCGSGETLAECCSIYATEAVPAAV